MNEKIKEIAEFDGWVLKPIYPFGKTQTNRWYHHNMNGVTSPSFLEDHYEEFPYLTDLSELHRVALDVMDRLQKVRTEHRQFHIREIICDMFCRPINGQYTDLVDAVYDAIVYLKNHNQCQPK